MKADLLFAGCGLICNDCEFFTGKREPPCPGCTQVKGKPFWGECQLYMCNREQSVSHCGICKDFPCDTFINQSIPIIRMDKKTQYFEQGF